VIAALELQDLVALAEGARQAHRIGIRLGPGAGEAHLLGAGHRLHDFGGQADAGFVVGEKRGAAPDLFDHRRRHFRMRVTDEHRAGAQQVIHILVAADIPDPAAPAFADDDRGWHVAERAGGQHLPGELRKDHLFVGNLQVHVAAPEAALCGARGAGPASSRHRARAISCIGRAIGATERRPAARVHRSR
jgi:hypothetical protein